MRQNEDPGYIEWADKQDAEDIEAQEQELQNQQAEQLREEEQC